MEQQQQSISKAKTFISGLGEIIIPWFAIMMLPLLFTYMFGGFVMFLKMRISIIRLGQTFVKARDSILPQKELFRVNSIQIVLGHTGLIFILTGIMAAFGMPTPDIRHDIRCIITQNYKDYALKEGITAMDHIDTRRVKGFRFHQGRMERNAIYGSKNEDMFKIQDYTS